MDVAATRTTPRRTAQVAVAWTAVTLRVPRQPRGEYRGVPLTAWGIRVWEPDPPDGGQPLEGILLTNVPTDSFAEAVERIDWHEHRWISEEYHKVLKTGSGIESPPFTTEAALQPEIALLSVTGLFLLTLRNLSRCEKTADDPARRFVPAVCAGAEPVAVPPTPHRSDRPRIPHRSGPPGRSSESHP